MVAPLHRPVALRAAPMGVQLEPAGIIILLIVHHDYYAHALFLFLIRSLSSRSVRSPSGGWG